MVLHAALRDLWPLLVGFVAGFSLGRFGRRW